jgi:hypothetical protein
VARFFTFLALLPLGAVLATAARANTLVCTNTLEAPSGLAQVAAAEPAAPVEVSRCAPVQTTDALVVNRFYTWTAPFARGTDLLGIAMAGPEGNRLMGLGFPDQTIIWDGSALQNTYKVLLEQQSAPIPWRTVDISSGIRGSLAAEQAQPGESLEVLIPVEASAQPVRGLW